MAPRPTKHEAQILFRREFFKARRKEMGQKSAEAAAEALRKYPDCETLSDRTVYNWERGISRPEVPQVLALQREYGVPVLDWFDWPGRVWPEAQVP